MIIYNFFIGMFCGVVCSLIGYYTHKSDFKNIEDTYMEYLKYIGILHRELYDKNKIILNLEDKIKKLEEKMVIYEK